MEIKTKLTLLELRDSLSRLYENISLKRLIVILESKIVFLSIYFAWTI